MHCRSVARGILGGVHDPNHAIHGTRTVVWLPYCTAGTAATHALAIATEAATSAATRRARADLHVGNQTHTYERTIWGISWGRQAVHHRGAVNVQARAHHIQTIIPSP